jgi:hypothetical protein
VSAKKTMNRRSDTLMHQPPLVPDGYRSKSTPRGFSNNPTGSGGTFIVWLITNDVYCLLAIQSVVVLQIPNQK